MSPWLAGALCCAAVTTAWPQTTPVIRVHTRLVEVNAIVRDRNGPIRGLTKADFTILDRGKPREISFFSANVPDGPSELAQLAPGTFTNEPGRLGAPAGSATIILLDGLNTEVTDQLYARRQFLNFLRQLKSSDRVAVYTLGRTLRVMNDFSNDAGRLARTLEQYHGRNESARKSDFPDDFETSDEKANAVWNAFLEREKQDAMDRRVAITAEALEAIADRLSNMAGRKSLIWISSAFPFALFGKEPKTYSYEVNRAARALNTANVAVYPVDARGLVTIPSFDALRSRGWSNDSFKVSTPLGQDTMDIFAQATGGRSYKNNNDIQGSIREILDQSQVTYSLSFAPDDQSFDGEFHKIKVKVNRPDAEVSCREGYLAADSAPAAEERGALIRSALLSPIDSSAVRIQAHYERGKDLEFTVVINPADVTFDESNGRRTAVLDAIVSQRTPAAAEAVEMKIVIFDRTSGRVGSLIVPFANLEKHP